MTCLRNCKYSFNHVIVFLLTFFSYAFLHATRKSFGNIKPLLLEVWTSSFSNETVEETHPFDLWNYKTPLFSTQKSAKLFLGALDSMFMIAYAVGLYISGLLGDKFDARIVLSFGMIISSLMVFIFGCVTEWLKFYNVYFYSFIWILNGLFQSTGWPCALAIMSNWFGESRGLIFGAWSACASVGNIIGDILVGNVVQYGYQYGLLLPASVLFSGGLFILFGLITHPNETKMNSLDNTPLLINESDDSDNYITQATPLVPQADRHIQNEPLSLIKILCLPGVILYSLSYACLKLVNYAFFFWLPYYLNSKFHWDTAKSDKISAYYDIGGILGGIFAGIISDYMWARSPITVAMLACAIPSLFLYSKCDATLWVNSLVMGVMGFFIGGPATIISSAISADLGSQETLAGNADALATVAGIVDGTGSAGAAFGQILVPFIEENYGWQQVFLLFMIMSSLTIVCILPIFIKDIIRKCGRQVPHIVEEEVPQ